MKKLLVLPLLLILTFNNAISQEFNDLQIASIAVTANAVDIAFADVALEISENSDVREFAETMKRDHNAVIGLAVDLVTKLGVQPDPNNDLTKTLTGLQESTIADLRKKSGKKFDLAYINNEVTYHETVIGVVRDVLIPQTQNAELKSLLEAVLPSLVAHLEHAKTVQANVNGTSTKKHNSHGDY